MAARLKQWAKSDSEYQYNKLTVASPFDYMY